MKVKAPPGPQVCVIDKVILSPPPRFSNLSTCEVLMALFVVLHILLIMRPWYGNHGLKLGVNRALQISSTLRKILADSMMIAFRNSTIRTPIPRSSNLLESFVRVVPTATIITVVVRISRVSATHMLDIDASLSYPSLLHPLYYHTQFSYLYFKA